MIIEHFEVLIKHVLDIVYLLIINFIKHMPGSTCVPYNDIVHGH